MSQAEPSGTPDAPVMATVERRAYLRYFCDAVAFCQQPNTRQRPPWRARVRDLSVQGMGLVFDQGLAAGTVLDIVLENAAGDRSVSLLALVRHGTRMPDASWLLGCQFSRPLTPAELDDLVGRPVSGEAGRGQQ
jgi:c-di-GMP-binding flagellar brake protein YcgR